MRLRRRELLALATALVAAGVGGLSVVVPGGSDRAERAAERLVGSLRNRASAAAVGREYLKTAPSEASLVRLLGYLGRAPDGRAQAAGILDRDRLRADIAAREKQDFEERNVVVLRGWILSRTEARLCALAALVADAAGRPRRYESERS